MIEDIIKKLEDSETMLLGVKDVNFKEDLNRLLALGKELCKACSSANPETIKTLERGTNTLFDKIIKKLESEIDLKALN